MIDVEVNQLVAEVDRIASHAQFNGLNMLTGRFAQGSAETPPVEELFLHVGANMDQQIQMTIESMTADALGLRDAETNPISMITAKESNTNIGIIDLALAKVNKQRADLGAYQRRLDHVTNSLMVGAENLQAAESRIRDTNMAKAVATFTKDQILNQASAAMLAQANQKSQLALQLLR